MATIICDECGGKTDLYVYCYSCFDKLRDEIKRLESQISDLESENMDLRKSGEEGGS